MARIGINEADHYKNTQGSFFGLKDDKDTAVVRFMYNDINDVNMDVVHEIDIDGKKRFVNCLRTYDEPIDNCPLCKAGYTHQIKLFVPLYNEDTKEVQIWQRGNLFAGQISGLCSRYDPLVSTPVEIERSGKKGDQKTTYQLYPRKTDDVTLEDLPEAPNPIGTIVMDKSFDELEYYTTHGGFKGEGVREREPEQTIQRRRAF